VGFYLFFVSVLISVPFFLCIVMIQFITTILTILTVKTKAPCLGSPMIPQPDLPVLCVCYDPCSAAAPTMSPALMVIQSWRDARIGTRAPQLHSGGARTSTSGIDSTFLSDVTSPDGEAAKTPSRMRRPSARSSRGHI